MKGEVVMVDQNGPKECKDSPGDAWWPAGSTRPPPGPAYPLDSFPISVAWATALRHHQWSGEARTQARTGSTQGLGERAGLVGEVVARGAPAYSGQVGQQSKYLEPSLQLAALFTAEGGLGSL